MFAYIVRRLVLMLVTLFGISVIIFVLLRIVPGNIVDILFAAAGYVDPPTRRIWSRNWGSINRSSCNICTGSAACCMAISAIPTCPRSPRWTRSCRGFRSRRGWPAWRCCSRPRSAFRSASSARCNQGTRLDYALRVVSLSGLSLPSFWLGLLILMASVSLFGTMPIFNPNPKTWTEAIAIYCVPAMAVGFRSAALTMRITRSSMLEILRQDYIRTARAKGASESSVNYRHALKNAILPVITVIGIEAAFLIGGLIVTETVFNIPGVARFLVEALRWRDYPIVQNLVMLIAVVVVFANFTVDMLYAAIDPRIRYTD